MARRSDRRSRTVLVCGLSCFLAVQVLGGLLLDYCWPVLRFPSFADVLSALAMTPAPRIVFLGSSRFQCGIDQEEAAALVQKRCRLPGPYPVLNASVPAGDPITAEFLLTQLFRKGVRPEWVVLEISPETLNEYHEWLGIHVRRQLRWEHVPGYLIQTVWSGQGMRFLSARLFAPYLHRDQILRACNVNLFSLSPVPGTRGDNTERAAAVRTPPPWDYSKDVTDWDQVLRPPHRSVSAKLRKLIQLTTDRQVGRWLAHFRIAGNSPAALERTLQLCQQRHVRVLLLAAPVSSPHRQTCTPAIEQQFQAYLAGLVQKYSCRFADCRDWMQDGHFLDNHHLGAEGRVYFSRLLAYHVLAPLKQDQPITTPKGSDESYRR